MPQKTRLTPPSIARAGSVRSLAEVSAPGPREARPPALGPRRAQLRQLPPRAGWPSHASGRRSGHRCWWRHLPPGYASYWVWMHWAGWEPQERAALLPSRHGRNANARLPESLPRLRALARHPGIQPLTQLPDCVSIRQSCSEFRRGSSTTAMNSHFVSGEAPSHHSPLAQPPKVRVREVAAAETRARGLLRSTPVRVGRADL